VAQTMKDKIIVLIDAILITIFTLILSKIKPDLTLWGYAIVFCVLCVILYIVIPFLDFLRGELRNLRRKYTCVKIGVLNGAIKSRVGEHGCVRAWTDLTPSMWVEELKVYFGKYLNCKIKLITTSEIDDTYSVIVNPFGDNFPEEDLRFQKTFNKICDYINKKGFFVVTGGAFFWHQNTVASYKEEKFITKEINGMQPLEYSPLSQVFGVNYTGDIIGKPPMEPCQVDVYQQEKDKILFGDLLTNVKTLKRFRATTNKSSDFVPVIRQSSLDVWSKDREIYPVAMIRYGDGFLIHAGLKIDSTTSEEFLVLIRLIKVLIDKNFNFIKNVKNE
jgi:hypothetical protein